MKYNSNNNFLDDIIVIIVLYHSTLEESKTFESLRNAAEAGGYNLNLVVYNNSPQVNITDHIDQYNDWFKIIVINDFENSGVGKAYNEGYKIACDLNKNWLLLLDQDTNLPVNCLDAYRLAINQYPGESLFAPVMLTPDDKIISPGNFKWMKGYYAKKVDYGINYLKGHSLINSGLCISVDAFLKNGGYNNLIKLDYSDHDFIYRFKKNVSGSYVVVKLKIIHHLSTHTRNSISIDKNRFTYYLDGANHFSCSFGNKILLRTIVFLRSTKLSIEHRDLYFIKKYFTHLFS